MKKAEHRLGEILRSGEHQLHSIPPTRSFFGQREDFFVLQDTEVVLPKKWYEGVSRRLCQFTALGVDNATAIPSVIADLSNDLDQAVHIVLTLWSAAKAHFPNKLKWGEHEESLLLSVLQWLPSCDQQQDFIPFLKYQLSWLFARGERQSELPPRPVNLWWKDGLLLLGQLGRFMRYKVYGNSAAKKAWRNTVLHGIKKGLPQMGESRLAAAAAGMKKRLTDTKSSPDAALREISRTAKEIYGRKGITEKHWNRPAKAWTGLTGNACFENSRRNGGAIGFLREEDEECYPLGQEQFRGMVYYPRVNQTKSVYFPSWTYEDAYDRFRAESLRSLDSRGRAQVSLIREPLKARAISAGDISSNCLFSDLQKKLWKELQRFPQFELTGRWVSVEDLSDIESQSEFIREKTGCNFTKWVSGDYSAATDNLHGDATSTAATAAAGDETTRKVLLRGLTNTEICFDNLRKQGIDAPENFLMTRGQLMGSVFSFPLLCAINIAMYRKSLEERTGQKFKISELPVRVNGDDILFKCDEELLRIWNDNIIQVGFEKSVGKNYVSENFAVINSVYFDTTVRIRSVPYLNLGWCTGVAKGCGEDSEKDLYRIRQQMDDLEKYWACYPKSDQIVREFKKQVFYWNEGQIKASRLPLDRGVWGLNLSDDVDTDGIYDEFRYWLDSNIDRPPSHGCKEFPKTMAPWKVVTTGSVQNDYAQYFRDFLERKWDLRLATELPFAIRNVSESCRGEARWKGVMDRIQREIRSGLTEYEHQYASLGKL